MTHATHPFGGVLSTPRAKRVARRGTRPNPLISLSNFTAAADLTVFHQYGTEGPDDFALGRSGSVYVSLAVANGLIR